MCIYIFIYINTYTYIYIYVYVYIHLNLCLYLHIILTRFWYTYHTNITHAHIYKKWPVHRIHTQTHACMFTYAMVSKSGGNSGALWSLYYTHRYNDTCTHSLTFPLYKAHSRTGCHTLRMITVSFRFATRGFSSRTTKTHFAVAVPLMHTCTHVYTYTSRHTLSKI